MADSMMLKVHLKSDLKKQFFVATMEKAKGKKLLSGNILLL